MPSPVNAIGLSARIMSDDLYRLGVVSQNLANASTSGYKKEIVAGRPFVEHLAVGAQAIPLSVPVLASVTDSAQGRLTQTSNPLDLALDGPGLFEVAGAEGPLYTRQGTFRLDATGRLVTPGGLAVQGAAGDILLADGSPRVDRQGRVFDGDRLVGQLKVVRFADPGALASVGGGLYRASGTGEVQAEALQVRQGFVEGSNVQTLPEMVRLIELVRRFESAQRVMQSYDGMLGGAIRTLGEF
jgi:flagellar basal-body rod protein FlgF